MILVAETEESVVHVDKQGRLVLPSSIRKNLGLSAGGEVSLKVSGSNVIIALKQNRDVEKKAASWLELALSTRAQIFSDEKTSRAEKESWKWMSRDYARRKLGLH